MRLYDYTLAPNPRQVRIFASEKGLNLDIVQVDLRKGEQFSDSFRAMNPRCAVPVLEPAPGEYICGVKAICGYLDECHAHPPWLLGQGALGRAQVTMWQNTMEEMGLAAVVEALRNTSEVFHNRALSGPLPIEQIPLLAERGRKRWQFFIGMLEARLEQSRYIAGEAFSMADITAWVSMDFARRVDFPVVDATSTPYLQRWHAGLCARPSAEA